MLGDYKKQEDLLESWGIHRVPKSHFLMKLDELIKWYRIEKKLKRLYDAETGRPSYPPLLLFKGLMLQNFYNLSDAELEEQIKDRLSFQKFLGISLESPVPDETTFCRFRQRLNDAHILDKLFDEINHQLEKKGILLKSGSIVDASIIESQNKNSDSDGKWVTYKHHKKAKFGYKLHVSCDTKKQLIQGLALTPANTADTKMLEEVMPPTVGRIYADKAYDNFKRRHQLRRDGIANSILTKIPKTAAERARNKRISRIRSRVERIFAHLKARYGYTHVRYRGLIRNKGHAYLLAMAYNMKRAVAMQPS